MSSTLVWADEFNDGLAAYKRKDYKTAFRSFNNLAQQGNANAQYELGALYFNGEGVPQDDAKARKLYLLAAQKGNADAQYDLGMMYDLGSGFPQDYAEALKWYRLAAQQGFASAQHLLGLMYMDGKGVPKDNVKAHLWLNLAAAAGNEKTTNSRQLLANKMSPQQIAKAQKMAKDCLANNYKGCN